MMTVQKAPRKQKRAPYSKGITEVSTLSIPEETFPHTMDTKSAPQLVKYTGYSIF